MNQNGPKGARFPTTFVAAGAILVGTIVVQGADAAHVAQSGANAAMPRGVTLDYVDAAERDVPVAYVAGELINVRAGAAFAAGSALSSDANGKAILAAGGAGTNNIIGYAREAATAADQLVLVELVQAGTKV